MKHGDIKNTSIREIARVAVGEAVVLVLMFIVFALFDRFDHTVILGGLLGAACNLIYFLLLCIGLNGALAQADPENRKKSMTLSYYLRLIALGIGIAIGLKLDIFNNIAVVVPVLMTRPIISVMEYFKVGINESVPLTAAKTDGDADDSLDEDDTEN